MKNIDMILRRQLCDRLQKEICIQFGYNIQHPTNQKQSLKEKFMEMYERRLYLDIRRGTFWWDRVGSNVDALAYEYLDVKKPPSKWDKFL